METMLDNRKKKKQSKSDTRLGECFRLRSMVNINTILRLDRWQKTAITLQNKTRQIKNKHRQNTDKTKPMHSDSITPVRNHRNALDECSRFFKINYTGVRLFELVSSWWRGAPLGLNGGSHSWRAGNKTRPIDYISHWHQRYVLNFHLG